MIKNSSTTTIKTHKNSQNFPNQNTSRQQMNSISNLEQVCKLCLSQIKKEQHFQACNCKGSLKVVHENCLIQWIKKRKDIKQILQKNLAVCQICQSEIKIISKLSLQCRPIEEAKRKILQEQSCLTIIFVIIQMTLGLCWVLLYFILPELTKLWIYFVVGIILSLICFIFYHLFKLSKQVVGIIKKQTKQEPLKRSDKIVHPFPVQIVGLQGQINSYQTNGRFKQ